ncbi:uncharacterized protein LOC143597182 [Bidens hawaiensis]|uniref:uncharacterized protein LOC143597182 n=1 Tax=Bidens hawaiensis TaxID=980011 RepID=UPI00404A5C01
MRRNDRRRWRDCKVIPGETAAAQHHLLVADVVLREKLTMMERKGRSRIRWGNLKGTNITLFKDKVISTTTIHPVGDANQMWEDMAASVTQVEKETLGVTTGRTTGNKESWWWNEDVQSKIKDKQQSLRDLLRCTNEGERWRLREKYKNARREAKKAVIEAKNTAYRRMYARLETKEREHHMFKIAKSRERRRQDLGVVKYIMGEDGHVLIKEQDIKQRWQNYFNSLFNGRQTDQRETDNPVAQRKQRNNSYCRGITQGEVRITLRKMGRAKAVGLDNIPIEAWKCLGDEGVQWLTTLFNLIFKNGKMPDQWRSSVVVLLYKNKGDAQCCGNYRGIKLLGHTMKLWERVIETRIRRQTQVMINQFGFMPGWSTTEAMHILTRLMEKYREKKRDLHMVFIDLEKAYDSVPRRLIWDSLEGRGLPRN